jgi:hypothetical protein
VGSILRLKIETYPLLYPQIGFPFSVSLKWMHFFTIALFTPYLKNVPIKCVLYFHTQIALKEELHSRSVVSYGAPHQKYYLFCAFYLLYNALANTIKNDNSHICKMLQRFIPILLLIRS